MGGVLGGRGELVLDGYRISVWEVRNVQRWRDDGDGYTAM